MKYRELFKEVKFGRWSDTSVSGCRLPVIQMLIKLLIAAMDSDYAGHLSGFISVYYADAVSVSVCSSAGGLSDLLASQRFDVALLDAEMAEGADLRYVHMPLLLWAEEEQSAEPDRDLKKVRKYQRISSIVADVLERYAKVTSNSHSPDLRRARVTAVWSPAGGVGKTTVALAFANSKAAGGKQAMYLNLEQFSSVPAYFAESGKSISSVFEMLEAEEGNLKMLIRGLSCRNNGVTYFCRPENFDDMNILSAENIAVLIGACSELTDELIIDMSCFCGERERQVFELADRILLVTDTSGTAVTKLSQFASQHNVFECIKTKSTLVNNMGAVATKPHVDSVIFLPLVQSSDTYAVYKTLSASIV